MTCGLSILNRNTTRKVGRKVKYVMLLNHRSPLMQNPHNWPHRDMLRGCKDHEK